MTKDEMTKMLDEPNADLKSILFDEARKMEDDDGTARRLADEAFDSLLMQFKNFIRV